MADWKSSIAILMGIIILVADVAWLVIGSSYTYTPWLILGIVIFVAGAIWLAVDVVLMRGPKPTSTTDSTFPKK